MSGAEQMGGHTQTHRQNKHIICNLCVRLIYLDIKNNITNKILKRLI